MGMLLQAEWRSDLQCFVKKVYEKMDETDGFVWPAPTFELYDREGREITGQRRLNITKYNKEFQTPKVNIPDYAGHYMTPNGLQRRDNGKSVATATAMRRQIDAETKRLSIKIEKDDHMLDALKYSMRGLSITHPTGVIIRKVTS